MFAVGTVNELNNAMYATGRTRAYWILVAYLLTSVGFVVLAAHRWANRSRLAFLVTPLVIVCTVVTLVITGGQQATVADSEEDFSGVQGQNGWYYGYQQGGGPYDPDTNFIPFAGGAAQGDWNEATQHWTGTTWDLLGRGVDGPNAGQQLFQVPAHNAFWFAWSTFWQNTGIL